MNSKQKQHGIILDFTSTKEVECIVHPVSSDSTFDFSMIGAYISSCNGLLYFVHRTEMESFICNPTTKECRSLPLSRFNEEEPPPGFWANCGPSGLGYDSRSDDYKVIRFVDYFYDVTLEDELEEIYPPPQDKLFAEVYSFKNGSWKSLANFDKVCCYAPCVYADGCFHWLQGEIMKVFDFTEETFSTISLEEDISESLKGALGVALVHRDGCLGVLANTSTSVGLWVKTKGGSSWNKEFEFDAPADLNPKGICKKEDAEFCYFIKSDCEVWVYDCAANQLEKLQIHVRHITSEFISYAETTESLARFDRN